jgi:predicted enzyme related to lactoylglutathione lyase
MSTRDTPWPAGTPCWVDISVPDVAAGTAFYGAVLGWDFVDSGAEYGHYTIAQVGGRAAAGLGPVMAEGAPTAWTLYFASDDADATAELVAQHGGSVLFEPMDIAGNGRMCVAVDPAGAAFGVWQARGMIGAGVVNEPGGLVWEDARLADPEAAKRFYSGVFGFTYESVEGAPEQYWTFHSGGDALGGIGGMMGAPEGTPSHWLTYFAVADTDAALAAARDAGGAVVDGPDDSPFGRIGVLADPFDATFAVIG